MNRLDGVHSSAILINVELMNLQEIILTKYNQNSVNESKTCFDYVGMHVTDVLTTENNKVNNNLFRCQQFTFLKNTCSFPCDNLRRDIL